MELHYWRKFSEFVLSLIKWVVADVVGNVEEGSGRGVCFIIGGSLAILIGFIKIDCCRVVGNA